MTFLPVLRRNDSTVYLCDGFFHIGAVIQHITHQHACGNAKPAWLVSFLDVHTHNGDKQSLFIDPIHTLIGQNIQQSTVKALQIRAARPIKRIIGGTPYGIRQGNRFIFPLGFAVQHEVQSRQGRIFLGYLMLNIVIPACDRFAVQVMCKES